jgi:hypothetical protein
VPRSEILVGLVGVVKCNVSMAQINDSYGCNLGLKAAAPRRFGTNMANLHAYLRPKLSLQIVYLHVFAA